MAQEFKLPELGEDVESGDVLKVLVAEGDTVSKDQPVLELETDKATLEVPVDVGGRVSKVHVNEGDTIKVGQVILTLDESEEKAEEEERAEEAEEREEEPAEEKAPRKAKKEEPAEKEPAEKEPEAEVEEEGEEEEPPPKKKKKARPEEAEAEEEEVEEEEEEPAERVEAGEVAPAAPSVRRLARELGVDVRRVRGSGPAGRISADDVKAHVRSAGRPSAAGASPRLPSFEKWGEVSRQRLNNVRRKTSEHVAAAWTTIPHVTQHDRADVTELERLRARYGDRVEAEGGKLTMTAIALKIAASALKRFPRFNASLDADAGELVLKHYCHIGVAVDTERGLLVPVVRDVDRKNVAELSIELKEIAEKARQGKLKLEDLRGGSFTITNLGGIGGTSFTPIVNWPEVAILGISRARVEPVELDGELVPRRVLPLSLSYDHRVIDGADAARFLRWVAEAFESPFLLALEG